MLKHKKQKILQKTVDGLPSRQVESGRETCQLVHGMLSCNRKGKKGFKKEASRMASKKDFPDLLCLRVVGYMKEGDYVAHCLEMDLIGVGSNFNEALEELKANIDSQCSFAVFKDNPDLLWHPAEEKFFEIFDGLFKRRIMNFNQPIKDKFEITQIPYPCTRHHSKFQLAYA